MSFLGGIFEKILEQGQLMILFILVIVGGIALVLLGTRAGRFFLGIILLFVAFWSISWGLSILFFGLIIFGIILMATAFVGSKEKRDFPIHEKKLEEQKRICPNCGRSIPFDAIVCPYCSQSFSSTGSDKARE